MNFTRKISVYMLAMLITYIGMSFPLTLTAEIQTENTGDLRVTWFEQAPAAPVYFIQEKASPVVATGWKTQIRLPGLDLFYDLYQTSEPELTLVRKIYVVDLHRYTPCKSLLLYPFHDFI